MFSMRSESLVPCVLEGDDVLDVPCLREEVERLDVHGFVSVRHDILRVSSLIAEFIAAYAEKRARV